MVEFCVRLSSVGGRLGRIEKWGSSSLISHSTPSFMVYTRAGHVPHLTWEVASEWLKWRQSPIYQMTLGPLIEMGDQLAKYGKGVGKFTGMPEDAVLHLSVLDPLQERKSGYNDSTSVAVWNHTGKRSITVPSLLSLASILQVHSVDAPFDYDTPENSTLKRQLKAADRTASWNERMKNDKPEKLALVSTTGGGKSTQQRRKVAETLSTSSAANVDLHGFDEEEENWVEVVKESLKPLREDALRVAQGAFSPSQVASLVRQGLDLFDSSWPIRQAEKGIGFRLHEDFPVNATFTEVDFNDQSGKADFTRPFAQCDCYSCKNYTTGYLCHLENTKELLAPLLLVIHNLSEWDRMFDLIRKNLAKGAEGDQ